MILSCLSFPSLLNSLSELLLSRETLYVKGFGKNIMQMGLKNLIYLLVVGLNLFFQD
jgi:hypothetical protein